MSVNPELRKLEIDIPSQPQALVQLSLLLAEEDINLAAAASLIGCDPDRRGTRVTPRVPRRRFPVPLIP